MALAAGTSSAAVAHSREWYVSNLPEAKATYERCLARVKGGRSRSHRRTKKSVNVRQYGRCSHGHFYPLASQFPTDTETS